MNDCLFCRIIAGALPSERVHEDERAIVIKDRYPKAPVHLLVIPRTHVASLEDLGALGDAELAHLLRLLPGVAAKQGLGQGFRTIINTGVGGGQEIFHLHIHLLGGGRLPGF